MATKYGTPVGEPINGTSSADFLYGRGGNDILKGFAGNDRLFGEAGKDVLIGGGGKDILKGGLGHDALAGGFGHDVLWGGAGADAFAFNTALNASTNVDRIADFSHAYDTIRLDDDIFTQLGPFGRKLSAGALAEWNPLGPQEADDRILFRHVDSADADTANDTIRLYYDPTGGSKSDAVLFAKLTGQARVTVDFSDFLIIA